jgi:hypothetical protein
MVPGRWRGGLLMHPILPTRRLGGPVGRVATTMTPRDPFAGLPQDRPPIRPGRDADGDPKDKPHFDWEELVSLVIHPLKIEIIEALLWIGEPLSAAELVEILDGRYSLSLIVYHAKALENMKAIEIVCARRVRGARESYYFFTEKA